MVVANASNAPVVSDALAERLAGFAAVLDDQSLATGLVAIQGPRSVEILQPLADVDLAAIRYYGDRRGLGRRDPGAASRAPATRARTGSSCSSTSIAPATPGTRCSTRDAGAGSCRSASAPATRCGSRPGMPLYGNELDRADQPVRGGPRPRRQARQARRLHGPRGAREGRARGADPQRSSASRSAAAASPATATRSTTPTDPTGVVTSGTMSPTLGKAIAMAYVAPADAEAGTMLDVEIREARVPAEVVPLPFYRRPPEAPPATPAARSRRAAARAGATRRSRTDGPRRPALHQGSRVDPRRGRRGPRRHHRLRGRPAGRHRVRGAARRRAAPWTSTAPSAWSSRSRR